MRFSIVGGNDSGAFDVVPQTGELRIKTDLTQFRGSVGRIVLNLSVRDEGEPRFEDWTSLEIILQQTNENPMEVRSYNILASESLLVILAVTLAIIVIIIVITLIFICTHHNRRRFGDRSGHQGAGAGAETWTAMRRRLHCSISNCSSSSNIANRTS